MRRYGLLVMAIAGLSAAALAQDGMAIEGSKPEPAKVEILKHSAWSDIVPAGVDGDGVRMNLRPNGKLEFKDLVLVVDGMKPVEESETGKETVTITLRKGEETETRTLDEGAAFNWNGYHISIVAIYMKQGDLGFGQTVFEVATVESLPKEVVLADTANGVDYRLKVKHNIDKLTLHHSATSHAAGDDLGKKLKNMQIWGENDRNWFDIPYHFIIDTDGLVFEARDYHYMGDTNTGYDPRGHFLINCYGNYMQQEPNEAQLESIAELMAWAAAEYDIDPIEIYGHRDLASTSCPGDNLYVYIENGKLKAMVEEILEKGQPELVWLEEKGGKKGAKMQKAPKTEGAAKAPRAPRN